MFNYIRATLKLNFVYGLVFLSETDSDHNFHPNVVDWKLAFTANST